MFKPFTPLKKTYTLVTEGVTDSDNFTLALNLVAPTISLKAFTPNTLASIGIIRRIADDGAFSEPGTYDIHVSRPVFGRKIQVISRRRHS